MIVLKLREYFAFNAVKCNLTKLTTKSAVSVLVSMVSDFWHTSMRMAIVGQRLLVFEHGKFVLDDPGTHYPQAIQLLMMKYLRCKFVPACWYVLGSSSWRNDFTCTVDALIRVLKFLTQRQHFERTKIVAHTVYNTILY